MISADFHVVTRAGALIRTFDRLAAAREFAEASAERFPGASIERVVRIERRSRVWPAPAADSTAEPASC